MAVSGKINLSLCPPIMVATSSSSSSSMSSSSLCTLKVSSSCTPTTTTTTTTTLSCIHNSGIIACLRAPSAELALGAARAALLSGIEVLEIVVSTPGVFEVGFAPTSEGISYNDIRGNVILPSFKVGTILKSEDAKAAIRAGAKFLMSPVMITDVHLDVKDSEVLYIPGAMTPTEIWNAYNAGARLVKIYPISALGGVEYISAIKKPFRDIPMVASQGINIGQVREYIARGASSVVLSDAIFDKEAVAAGDFECISKRAQLAASVGIEAVKRNLIRSQ